MFPLSWWNTKSLLKPQLFQDFSYSVFMFCNQQATFLPIILIFSCRMCICFGYISSYIFVITIFLNDRYILIYQQVLTNCCSHLSFLWLTLALFERYTLLFWIQSFLSFSSYRFWNLLILLHKVGIFWFESHGLLLWVIEFSEELAKFSILFTR